ncbi:Serine/Threonine protein kinases active-site signature [Nakaseomyces glabratus]
MSDLSKTPSLDVRGENSKESQELRGKSSANLNAPGTPVQTVVPPVVPPVAQPVAQPVVAPSAMKDIKSQTPVQVPQAQVKPQSIPPVAQPQIEEKFPAGKVVTVGSHRVEVVSYLAEGGFAQIYVVKFVEYTNEFERKNDESMNQPLKPGSPACLKRVLVQDEVGLNKMRSEVEVMKKLQGAPNIVQYFDSNASRLRDYSGNITQGFEVLLLMELCPNKSLLDYMNQRLATKLTEQEIFKIMYDITLAVAQMHYLPVPLIHRDIKIENVLVDANNNFKLCDFGSTSTCFPAFTSFQDIAMLSQDLYMHTTPQYRSPEMIDLFKYIPINEKSDIWALGVFLYKLLFFTTPFERTGQFAMLHSKFEFPPNSYSSKLINLIIVMLAENPSLRPNIYQVLYYLSEVTNREVPPTVLSDKYGQGPYNFEKYTRFQKESQQVQLQLSTLQAKINDPNSTMQPADWELYDRMYMSAFTIVPQLPVSDRKIVAQNQFIQPGQQQQSQIPQISNRPIQSNIPQIQQMPQLQVPPSQASNEFGTDDENFKTSRSKSNQLGYQKENNDPKSGAIPNFDGDPFNSTLPRKDSNAEYRRSQLIVQGNIGPSRSMGSVSPVQSPVNYNQNHPNFQALNLERGMEKPVNYHKGNPFEQDMPGNNGKFVQKGQPIQINQQPLYVGASSQMGQNMNKNQEKRSSDLEGKYSNTSPSNFDPSLLRENVPNKSSMSHLLDKNGNQVELPPRPKRSSMQSQTMPSDNVPTNATSNHTRTRSVDAHKVSFEGSSDRGFSKGNTNNKVQDKSAQNILEEEGFFENEYGNRDYRKEVFKGPALRTINSSPQSARSDNSSHPSNAEFAQLGKKTLQGNFEKPNKKTLDIDYQEVDFSPALSDNTTRQGYFEGQSPGFSDQLSYDLNDALEFDRRGKDSRHMTPGAFDTGGLQKLKSSSLNRSQGSISSGANEWPESSDRLHNARKSLDLDRARQLHNYQSDKKKRSLFNMFKEKK